MAWITIIKHSEAKGLLKRQYDAAIKRADKIWNRSLPADMKQYNQNIWRNQYPSGNDGQVLIIVNRLQSLDLLNEYIILLC